jgi:zinc resistance-associated protein
MINILEFVSFWHGGCDMRRQNSLERSSKMRKMLIVVLVMGLVASGGLAMAQGWGRGPGMGYGPYGPGMRGNAAGGPYGLGPGNTLTPEQVQKMQALQEKFFKETAPIRNDLVTKRLELRTLWSQANPDQEKILAKQKEINTLREQLQEKSTQKRLEALKVLTPEQREQMGAYYGGMGFGPKFGHRGFGPGTMMGYGYGHGYGYGACPRW